MKLPANPGLCARERLMCLLRLASRYAESQTARKSKYVAANAAALCSVSRVVRGRRRCRLDVAQRPVLGSPISARTIARSWFGFVGFIKRRWCCAVPGGKSDTCPVIIRVRAPNPIARSAR